MNTLHKLRDIGLSGLIGAFTGAAVGLAFCGLFRVPFWPAVGMSAGVGLLIGLLASLAFTLFIQYAGRYPVAAFLAVALIIGGGTALGARLIGGPETPGLGWLIGVSEAAGLTITCVWYFSYRRWNEKLRAAHKKLAVRPPGD